MKKIFALALAIVMMMAIALPVFAAAESISTTYDEDNGSHQVPNFELEYGVAQTYTVIIPEDISFNDGLKDQKRTISVENAIIAGNERIEISMISLHNWMMKDYETNNTAGDATSNISDPVDYWFSKNTGYTVAADAERFTYTKTTPDDAVLIVNRAAGNVDTVGANGKVDLYFSTRGTAQEGTYRDYLTFVVEIGTYVAPQQGN